MAADYCGSRWAHKAHVWYDAEGKKQECPGAAPGDKETKPHPSAVPRRRGVTGQER